MLRRVEGRAGTITLDVSEQRLAIDAPEERFGRRALSPVAPVPPVQAAAALGIVEVYVSRVLDRSELRALCDTHETQSAIVAALSAAR